MAATGYSNINVWKEMASERDRNARVMTIVSVILGFALLASVSHSYASNARYTGLCGQIESINNATAKPVKEMTAQLIANYCN
jgi:hypothetical protein